MVHFHHIHNIHHTMMDQMLLINEEMVMLNHFLTHNKYIWLIHLYIEDLFDKSQLMNYIEGSIRNIFKWFFRIFFLLYLTVLFKFNIRQINIRRNQNDNQKYSKWNFNKKIHCIKFLLTKTKIIHDPHHSSLFSLIFDQKKKNPPVFFFSFDFQVACQYDTSSRWISILTRLLKER